MRGHLAHLAEKVRPGSNICSGRHRDTSETSLLELEGCAIFMLDSRMHTKAQDTNKCICQLGQAKFTTLYKHTACALRKATEQICFSSGNAKQIYIDMKGKQKEEQMPVSEAIIRW